MALIPPHFLNTVVALGTRRTNSDIEYNATGFLYGHRVKDDNGDGSNMTLFFLVTNRHVADGYPEMSVRFNSPLPSGSNIYSLPPEGDDLAMPWTVHPDSDVAVRLVNFPKLTEAGAELSCLYGTDHTLSLQQARQSGVGEGDGVFTLGFPLGMAGEQRNYVIVRQGIIARIQGWLDGHEHDFLIDASIFPGNSGGPVFTKPQNLAIKGTQANDRCALIGMVSSYLPYREVAVSTQTGRTRMVFEENSGLGVVIPIDRIEETVARALDNFQTSPQVSSQSTS